MSETGPELPPLSTPERRLIGNALISASDDDFCNGYTAGYLTYHVYYRDRVLSEQEIYDFLMKHLHNVTRTDRWNVGFILGWIARMHEKGKSGAGKGESE